MFIIIIMFVGENTVNGDQSDAHMSTLSQSSKEVRFFNNITSITGF